MRSTGSTDLLAAIDALVDLTGSDEHGRSGVEGLGQCLLL